MFRLLLFILVLIVPLAALIDILKSDFKGYDKILWVLVVLLSSIFGAILYFSIGRKQKINRY